MKGTDKNPVCSECGFPIPMFDKYWKHEDGTILCRKCWNKMVKKGDIK